jgi:hypothetical protein
MGEIDDRLLEALTKQTEAIGSLTEKVAGTSPTAIPLHGVGGLFGVAGIERDVINAYVRPFGIGKMLPLLPSNIEDPRFASITGFTNAGGEEPDNACEDAPSGYMKSCMLTAKFGLLRRDTQTIEIDKVILRANRGDFTDLVLRGRVLGLANLAPGNLTEEGILDIVTKAEMVGVGVQAERKLTQDMWTGTIATGTFPGLDVQIATGQVDAETNTLCPALDSDVKDFAYDNVDGTDGRSIVEYLSMLCYYLQYNADTMGLNPASWVIAMRPELWFELSAIWPCQYLSHRCGNGISMEESGGMAMIVNDNVNVAMRDAMRNGMYLDVNGIRYPVVTDVGIFEHTNINNANLLPGQYASSIYVVPLTITGNFPVTYREYLNYNLWGKDSALLNGMETFWTDNGVYSWAIENTKWCFKLALKTEQRIVLRTPQLAGKIQRVMYSPLQHLRTPFANDPYNFDGGVSMRSGEEGYARWNTHPRGR